MKTGAEEPHAGMRTGVLSGAGVPAVRQLVPFVSAVLIGVFSLICFRSTCLVIRNAAGSVSAAFALKGELQFSLEYTHSVALLPCREFLTALPDGRIRIDGTEYSGLGAGLPYDSESGIFSMNDGSVTLSGMERYVPGMALLPSPFRDHTLKVAGGTFSLRSLVGRRGICTFSVERLPVIFLPGYFDTDHAANVNTEVIP